MKKFFLFLTAVLFPAVVLAAPDDDAIRKCIVNFYLERGSMNIGKALEYCTQEFSEGPGEVNYRTLQATARHIDTLLKSEDWEAVNESVSMIFQGHLPDNASRAEARKIKNTPAAKVKIAAARQKFEDLRKKKAAEITQVSFVNIFVSGNTAKVEIEEINNIDTVMLKKISGKWLITRMEWTDWKRKAAERKRAAEKAAAEKEISGVVTAHRKAILMLDLKKAIALCDRKYRESSPDGTVIDIARLETLAACAELMEKSNDLLAVMENALLLQGEKLSDVQRQKITARVKKGEAAEIIGMVRENFRKLRQDGEKAASGIKVVKITLRGNAEAQAEVALTGKNIPKPYVNLYSLEKKNGKWLIVKVDAVKNK